MIRIIIVDDQNFTRKAINTILRTESNFLIVGEAENGFKALELINQVAVDIAIVDLDMPEMNGFELTQRICQKFSNIKVIVLSSNEDRSSIDKAVKSGARGYLLKDTSTEYEIVDTINHVQRGYFQLGPGLFENLISDLISYEEKTSSKLSIIENNHNQNFAQLKEEILLQSKQIRHQLFDELNLEINSLKFEFGQGLHNFQNQVSEQIKSGLRDFANQQKQDKFTPEIWHKRYAKLAQSINLIENQYHLSLNKLKKEIVILRYCVIFTTFLLIAFIPIFLDSLFNF
ncbi:Response regulator containing a CheY-like receiver domain and an HTH DNA-binding domain [Hyella patelloides LEGE 07179]|uniref:Response regulator containing a CheY-like receiver domain and an HTH DNA-binding domain n=1 Tax=Hyella patelloides LEGE 07179 TaxID=945734 RepID=A0A563VYL8_9CYAN|nr:response regulator transcription factor [Hyella patelloides]VEP16520.1 Response regulator containing a CheY-like receiver domain and an HTH DNA-binding domain [Hyella patelloides LEGE 07179]